jgi:hypothetical protein
MTFSGRRHVRTTVVAALGAVALSTALYAQTPPRPAVEIRQLPTLCSNLWPADFNEDGRTDLVAGRCVPPFTGPGPVVVRTGVGNGTFNPEQSTGVLGAPVNTGDFNNDGFIDVVVLGSGNAMSILPGRGNASFDAARTLDPVSGFRFALSADLNADGNRDLVIAHDREAGPSQVEVHPGNGDFTFGPAMILPTLEAAELTSGIVVDLNGDGRRDIAVTQGVESVVIYLNRGGLLFDIGAAFATFDFMRGITAGDLNRDGNQDLIVTHSDVFSDWTTGGVEVLLGNGDGTMDPPVHYETGLRGPFTVVVGQFNGDALLDVAVGGRSSVYMDVEGAVFHYWDSVSIFPGLGDGRLGAAAPFRLDTKPATQLAELSLYTNTHHSLKTSDVNGDGRTDLITSPGAIVLNRPAAANRPPVVDAGPDLTIPRNYTQVHVSANIAEPDWDWLQVEWREEDTGSVVSRAPSFWYTPSAQHTLRVTVTDVRGGVATDTVLVNPPPPNTPPDVRVERPSDEVVAAGQPYTIRWSASDDTGISYFDVYVSINDRNSWTPIAECTALPADLRSCVWRNPGPVTPVAFIRVVAIDFDTVEGEGQSPTSFRIEQNPTGPGGLPIGWSCGPVGAVAVAGRCSRANGVYTIEGSGADIFGTADEFQFAGLFMDGNFSITARVTSVENVNQWTKVGIMIRDWNAGSPGSRHASYFVTPSTVRGTAFQRRHNQGGTTLHTSGPATTAPVWLKLVRSGNVIRAFSRKNITNAWTLVGTHTFSALPARMVAMLVVSSHVDGTLATGRFDNVVVDQSDPVQSFDVGASSAGTSSSDFATVTMQGNGAGVGGTADAFRFRYVRWFGDGTITARVRSLENTSALARAGVMFRESLNPGSKHVMTSVTAGSRLTLQSRSAFDGATSQTSRAGAAPEWLRLTRSGNTFSAATSNDGVTWTTLGTATVTIGNQIYVGLAVSSHASGTLATAVFDDVWIRP